MRALEPDFNSYDRRASPSMENRVVTKMGQRLHKASIHTGDTRGFLLSSSKLVKHFE